MTHKIALVGIGKIAVDQHVPALAASDDFDLAATASRNAGVDGVDRHASLADLLAARGWQVLFRPCEYGRVLHTPVVLCVRVAV